jgi:hypothetical protein
MRRGRVWLAAGFVVAAGLFFGLSDPSKVPSFVLIIGFGLLVAILYQGIYGLLTVSSWYGFLPNRRSRQRLATVTATALGSLVALQSIGELSHRDVLVLMPLMIGVYFYTYAARTEKKQ